MTTKEGGLRGSIRNVGVGVSGIPDSGVLRYDFEDDSNTSTYADSWNDNGGTNEGGTFTTPSKYGDFAIEFTSDTEYGTFPNLAAIDVNSDFSLSAFIYLNSLPSGTRYSFIAPQGQYDITFGIDNDSGKITGSANVVYANIYDGSDNIISSGVTPNSSEYVLVGLSTDGLGNYDIVVSGSIENSASLPTPNSAPDENYIGTRVNVSGFTADYKMDRFDVYDKQLNSTEWSDLASTGNI